MSNNKNDYFSPVTFCYTSFFVVFAIFVPDFYVIFQQVFDLDKERSVSSCKRSHYVVNHLKRPFVFNDFTCPESKTSKLVFFSFPNKKFVFELKTQYKYGLLQPLQNNHPHLLATSIWNLNLLKQKVEISFLSTMTFIFKEVSRKKIRTHKNKVVFYLLSCRAKKYLVYPWNSTRFSWFYNVDVGG